MKRYAVAVAAAAAVVPTQIRQAHASRPDTGGVGASARRQKLDHRHPLARQDPASRNVIVPNSVHKPAGSAETLTAAAKASVAKRNILRRYEEELLWGSDPVVDRDDHWLANHIAQLRNDARYRYSNRMMVVAGRDVIRELNQSGIYPQYLMVPEKAKGIPEWATGKGSEIVRVSESVINTIAPGTDGYIGNFTVPEGAMTEELMANSIQMKSVLVLDNVDDPGTLGSLLRTAAGMAYDAVFLTHHCADLYDHRVVSAARGAHFQNLTKFFTLNDADGDDVYGLMNHVADRNNLTPAVYTPHVSDPDVVASSGLRRRTMAEFCMDEYFDPSAKRAPSSAATKDILDAGQMLIMGPDHRRTLAKRMATRLRRPAALLDLESPLQFSLAAPIAMQSLRPTASWDYQLGSTSSVAMDQAKAQQMSTHKAQIGPDRVLAMPEPNMSLDEWEYAVNMKRVRQRDERMSRYFKDDLVRWEELQMARIKAQQYARHDRRMNPFKGTTAKPRTIEADGKYPDYIAELKEEGLDRDSIREVAKWAKNYTPPPNYDTKFKPATPTVRRGRVVPTY